MTRSILIESQCLPPVQVIHTMLQFDEVIIEVHENYQKRSFRNRIYLAGPQGKSHFTIPLVKGKHEGQSIGDVRIAYEENWIDQFTRILRSNYSSAPFYQYYKDSLIAILSQEFQYLVHLNRALLNRILKITDLPLSISESSSYIHNQDLSNRVNDYRSHFLPAQATTQSTAIKYRQVYEAKHGFIPNLSILDMIMCCGPELPHYFPFNPNEL